MTKVRNQLNSAELPSNWVLGTIGELVGPAGLFTDGDWVESKDQDLLGRVSLIQLADVGDGRFTRRSKRMMNFDRAQEMNCTFLHKGDILIARMPEPLGRACIYPGNHDPAVTVVDVCVVRGDPINYDNRWLMYFLNAPEFRDQVLSKQSGSTRKRISRGNLAALRLPIPPRPEQTGIADRLDTILGDLTAASNELQEAGAKIQPLRQSLLQSAISGELTFEWRKTPREVEQQSHDLLADSLAIARSRWRNQQLEIHALNGRAPPARWESRYKEPAPAPANLPALPEGWIWATVEQLGEVRLGRQRSPEKASGSGQTKYIRAANITENGIELSDVLTMAFSKTERRQFRLEPGDILLTEASGSPEHVGRPAVWEGADDAYCFQNTVIRFRPYAGKSAYFFRVFQAWQKLGRFGELSQGVGINHLTAGKFARIPVPLPPPMEQAEIAKKLDSAITEIDHKERSITALLESCALERRQILSEAYNGRLVPQSADHEPASSLLEKIQAGVAPPVVSRSRRPAVPVQPRRGRVTKAIDVLRAEKDWIDADDLFKKCGIRDGVSTELVEEIYAELRVLDQTRKLAVRRVENGDQLKLLRD